MSEIIRWSPTLGVGVEKIDEQHRELFATINRLIKIIPEKKGKADVLKLLNELLAYATNHFSSEQEYLGEHPDFVEHLYQHLEFEKKIITLKEKIILGQEDIALACHKVLIFLLSWLQNHILHHDVRDFAALGK